MLSTHTLYTPLLTPHALATCVITRSTIIVYRLTHRKWGRFRFINPGQMGQGLIIEFTRYEKYRGHLIAVTIRTKRSSHRDHCSTLVIEFQRHVIA